MLEREIEKKVCDYAKEKGVYCRKFTSPSNRSVPDRIFIYEGKVIFIEFKSTVGRLTRGQRLEIEKITNHAVNVFMVNEISHGLSIIDLLIKCKVDVKTT